MDENKQPAHSGETKILVRDLLNIIPANKIKVGDYFMFLSGKRLYHIFSIQANEIFYNNLLTKKAGKIKLNNNKSLMLINISYLFNIKNIECPF